MIKHKKQKRLPTQFTGTIWRVYEGHCIQYPGPPAVSYEIDSVLWARLVQVARTRGLDTDLLEALQNEY